jgi:hypothetical protein
MSKRLDLLCASHHSRLMKTLRKQQRKINSITNGRWAAYMAAAAATTLAGADSAKAAIHYSGLLNQKIGPRDAVTFELDPDGGSFVVSHFNFVGGSSNYNAGGEAYFGIDGGVSASVNGVSINCGDDLVCASKLERGAVISEQPFAPDGGILAFEHYFNGWYSYGEFLDRGIGLVGFKFNNGGGDQFGWVRVKMMGGLKNTFEMVDYAYGDPGDVGLPVRNR